MVSQPARVARWVLGPDAQRLERCLLHGVLGAVEVFAAAHQAGEHQWDESAELTLVPLGRL